MANASEQSAVAARAGRPFTFTRKRGNATAEFFPGAGARLRFASNDTDVLSLPGLPVGMLARNDVVIVQYRGTTVFRGTVATRVERQGRGTDRVEDVTVEGPWGLMARLVFRQEWKVAGANGAVVGASCSRLVLNQDALGVPQDMTAQVREIASYAAAKCGFAYAAANVDAGAQQLPADEARDITCAAAIMRTLRFFPQTVCRFDYAPATPAFLVSIPPASPTPAAYLASIPMTQRTYARTAHPVVGVDIATEGFDLVTGDGEADATLRSFSHQTAGETDSVDTLHIFLPLAKGSSSTSWESLDVETIDASTYTNINFWIQHHPALAGYSTALSATNRVEFAASGSSNITPSPLPWPRLTSTTVGDLRRFGLHAEVVRMTGTFKLVTPDKEESVVLTLDWVCTDATTRTYTRQTGSSSTAGETLPAGLAAAILAQRGGEVTGEEATIRLGDAFPTLGDADVVPDGAGSQALYLQSFEVDCYDLTARLHFGRPAHLSPEDMRDLLLGFRQRGFASNAPNRNEPDADDNMDDQGGVQPITSSSSVVSSAKKATFTGGANTGNRIILDTDAAGAQVQVVDGNSKTITLNPHALAANDMMQVHTLTYTDGSGQVQTIKVLATDNAAIPPGGGGGSGEDPDAPDFSEGITGNKTVVAAIRYDATAHKLQAKFATATYTSGIVTGWAVDDEWTDVFEAEEHSAEVS